MNNFQRVLLSVYLPVTAILLVLDWLYPGVLVVRIFKFAAIASLLFPSLALRKTFHEQKVMSLALFFTVSGDFFLGFGNRIRYIDTAATPLGMLSYCLAYLLLSFVFSKKRKSSKFELIAAIPIAIQFVILLLGLAPFINGPLLYGAIIFGIVLCYMSWSSICTIFRGYYSKNSSVLLALAGILVLISDTAVAHSLFNPSFAGKFTPFIENIIWATFVPAWTLIVCAISSSKLLK